MGSNFDLSPIAGGTSDPMARIFQKQAELETRIMQLEAKRDIIITPVGPNIVNSGTPWSFIYDWKGGRTWILWAASASHSIGAASHLSVGLTAGSMSLRSVSAYVPGASVTSVMGVDSFEVLPANMTLGSTTFTFSCVTVSTSAFVTGMIIEWPQA